jgi:hypothetical protein
MTSPTNETRVAWADAALRYYRDTAASTEDDKLADLLTDLMHWATANSVDFALALSRAEMNHSFETGGLS